MEAAALQPTFVRLGPAALLHPVLLCVPHAGRDYPAAMLANAAVPRDRLEALEDRHVDALIAQAVAAGHGAFVAQRARCWLDLNRDEREIDAGMLDPPPPSHRLIQSAKVRGGLGLIPRRAAGVGELWRATLPAAEVEARIAGHHRPYHAAVAEMLETARARFGAALLLDCHSMPPVPSEAFGPAPRIVLGDRFGRSAGGRLVDRIAALIEDAGLTVARNAPYAGGYTLDRHGRPARNVHAIQIEIDRSLYLDADRRGLGPGAAEVGRLLKAIATAMAEELAVAPSAIAAE